LDASVYELVELIAIVSALAGYSGTRTHHTGYKKPSLMRRRPMPPADELRPICHSAALPGFELCTIEAGNRVTYARVWTFRSCSWDGCARKVSSYPRYAQCRPVSDLAFRKGRHPRARPRPAQSPNPENHIAKRSHSPRSPESQASTILSGTNLAPMVGRLLFGLLNGVSTLATTAPA
jgi:hypothetical protein